MSKQVLCKLRFQCFNRWEDLEPVKGANKVRYCSDCKETVYFIDTPAEYRKAIENQRCIAFASQNDVLLGDVLPEFLRDND